MNQKLGRVYTDDAEYVWWGDGWTSEQDPQWAKILTDMRCGQDLNTTIGTPFQDTLDFAASRFAGAKTELFLKPLANDTIR